MIVLRCPCNCWIFTNLNHRPLLNSVTNTKYCKHCFFPNIKTIVANSKWFKNTVGMVAILVVLWWEKVKCYQIDNEKTIVMCSCGMLRCIAWKPRDWFLIDFLSCIFETWSDIKRLNFHRLTTWSHIKYLMHQISKHILVSLTECNSDAIIDGRPQLPTFNKDVIFNIQQTSVLD